MRILISAAETSSDLHGAELLKALKRELGADAVEAVGIGGPKLQAQGLNQAADARDLLAMGSSEVFGRLPKILEALESVTRQAIAFRPDVAVLIDYPDFHFRLARRLKAAGIPVVYYIPPKVWVWRKHRLKTLRELVDRVLCIFPFEEKIYQEAGIPVTYVGNPLVDELPIGLSREDARAKLGLADEKLRRVLLLMPGSRPAELKRHFKPMLEAAGRSTRWVGDLVVLVPYPATTDQGVLLGEYEHWKMEGGARYPLEVRFISPEEAEGQGGAYAMAAADAGLVKSGTSTLEAGLMGCPHSVVYKPSPLTAFIYRKFIRYDGPVGLVNLVGRGSSEGGKRAERPAFREILMDEFTVRVLEEEIASLLMDDGRRASLKEAAERLHQAVRPRTSGAKPASDSPSALAAAQVILQARAGTKPAPVEEQVEAEIRNRALLAKFMTWMLSALWSGVNAGVRYAVKKGKLKPQRLDTRVISVGNIQAGGAGKTPIVARIAREALERGLKTAILCRGYGGLWERKGGVIAPGSEAPEAEICGDEAALLHDLVPGAWIGVGADRIRSYQQLREKTPLDLVILDDGFQHWKIQRDLDVIALTSHSRFDVLYRDWPRVLGRAGLLVWTKGGIRPPVDGAGLVRMDFRIPSELAKREGSGPYWLVTGVADSGHVRLGAERAGLQIEEHFRFKDHARYSAAEVRRILQTARKSGRRLVVTGKDWVKWREFLNDSSGAGGPNGGGLRPGEILVLEPEIEIVEGQEHWRSVLWEG